MWLVLRQINIVTSRSIVIVIILRFVMVNVIMLNAIMLKSF